MKQKATAYRRQNPSLENGSTLDLKAYFQRIGYTDSRPAPNLETLQAIQRLHPQAIAFENFNPLLGVPVLLDLPSLQQKMVHYKRGGYCFEHNLLLYHVLIELGFTVTPLAGRVLWNKPVTQITARTHMLLLVEIEGENYISDVGFGTMTPTAPLLLKPEIIQNTPNESYQLFKEDGGYLLQAKIDSEWKPLYRFNLQPQNQIDYKVANWYVSTHPDSHFVTGLTVALSAPGRRYTLSNNQFSIHGEQEGTSKQKVTDAAQLQSLLEDTFNISLSGLPKVEALLKRLVQKE